MKHFTLFQFHKVRLKECSHIYFLFLLLRFQFHKVRLKDGGNYRYRYTSSGFNSTRYD